MPGLYIGKHGEHAKPHDRHRVGQVITEASASRQTQKGKSMSTRNQENSTGEQVERFEVERLTAEELYQVAGGLMAQCTANTVNVCHIDGTDD